MPGTAGHGAARHGKARCFMKRTTVTIPDDVIDSFRQARKEARLHGRRLNLSRICTDAIRAAVEHETTARPRMQSMDAASL